MAVETPVRTSAAEKTGRERIEALDLLRGGAMLLVVAYHILYDLKFIYGKDIPRAVAPGQPAQPQTGGGTLHTGLRDNPGDSGFHAG